MSITKTASKKIGALIHAMKFLSPDVALHSVHWGINSPPPQKHYPLFLAKPPLNQQTVQVPLFRQYPPLYRFFVNPP